MSTESNVTVKQANVSKVNIRKIAQVGMLSAVAMVLMLFEFPLPFAPAFYKIDLSEVPVLVGSFVMGPAAGAVIEFIKILLNLLINGTETAGVGEAANFIIGCSFCVPAGFIYKKMKTRTGALIGMSVGSVTMVVLGSLINAFVLLPTYAAAFQMPIDGLILMGSAINPAINNLTTFVLFAVVPFNLVKAVIASLIVFFTYKKISPILKMGR